MSVVAGQDLVVSLYVPDETPISVHRGSLGFSRMGTLQYQTGGGAGDHTSDESGSAFSARDFDIFWTDAVEVDTQAPGTVVAIGDSLTEGSPAVNQVGADRADAYDRYTDVLSRRLLARGAPLGVTNAGLNGDTAASGEGRFERDVLQLSGVTHTIILLGSNDVAGTRGADEVIAILSRMAERARHAGIVPIGATIPPRQPVTPTLIAARHAVNSWIRRSRNFSGFVDFDAILRDPADPERLRPQYDAGDGTHPNPTGLAAMGNGVDLNLFASAAVPPVPGPAAATALAAPPRPPFALSVRAPRRVAATKLANRGLAVRVRVNRPALVDVKIVAGEARSVGRVKLHLAPPGRTVRVRMSGSRPRPSALGLIVNARAGDGARREIRRRIVVSPAHSGA